MSNQPKDEVTQTLFQDYVTSTAFSLSLSRGMCVAMELVMRNSMWDGGGFQTMSAYPRYSAMQAIERRGLVKNHPWRMTEAGNATYRLLELAQLVTPLAELKILMDMAMKRAREVA